MKIAIFHDYFGAIGGGEKVVITLAKILKADIITTDTDAVKKIDPDVEVISLGRTINYPGLKQISATLKFFSCDFSKKYDLFIFSGNWAHYAANRHHPNLWYCYTPIRVFYDLYPIFLYRQNFFARQLFRIWVYIHRFFDHRSLLQVDRIIAISGNVQNRILKYYNRTADIVYPPIDTTVYRCIGYGNFWLSVNRLYPEKRIELQIEAFRQIPEENLVIVGGYSKGDHAAIYAEKVCQDLPSNVTFRGEVSENELVDLYARCKGLICTALDEDYGLTPLEAMASGKAVIAVDSGGFRETVTSDTGVLVQPTAESIMYAIREVSRDPARYHDACLERAKLFDVAIFGEKIRTIVFNILKER